MRQIKVADNLMADVEGDIEDVDGVLRITKIRLQFRLKAPPGSKEIVDRVLLAFAEKCPAYQSVKGCIDCSWDMNLTKE